MNSQSTLNGLYTSKQLYRIESNWFEAGHDSFSLMQQASWQMACWIENNWIEKNGVEKNWTENSISSINVTQNIQKSALVWVGSGNNGGDGWLVAHYLRQFGWRVDVVEVAQAITTDSKRAKKIAQDNGCTCYLFLEDNSEIAFSASDYLLHIDALFGIGLDREPTGIYAKAINQYNQFVASCNAKSLSIDIPSGLVASTGQVFNGVGIKSDVTLCLIANKLGLFTKDGKDYTGEVVTLPLIPLVNDIQPVAIKLTRPLYLTQQNTNSHKGSFGHVLIIGGNKTAHGQGMGGASILATQGAFAVGVGKVSVACHLDYHASLITNMPNAMSVNLHNVDSVSNLIAQVEVVAIGMGLGREVSSDDETENSSKTLFEQYIHQAMSHNKDILIDADGLYHLATCSDECINNLKNYAKSHFVAYTPHSGEMARLLNISNDEVEKDRLSAIKQAYEKFGGHWLLKGAGSLVIENDQCYLCDAGNSGMATAGMGDILSGIVAGLQAQYTQNKTQSVSNALINGVMIHAMAGDNLATEKSKHAIVAQYMSRAVATVLSQY